jgi:hypothetical protein
MSSSRVIEVVREVGHHAAMPTTKKAEPRPKAGVTRTFRAPLATEDDGFFIEVPFDVKQAFGKARPPISLTVAGYTFSTTVSVYGGRYYLPVRRDRREAAGVRAGDVVDVRMELDTSKRTVKTPRDLAAALAKNAIAKAAWDGLAYTHKLEHALAIEDAKKPETRARRVEKAIEMLVAKAEAKPAKRPAKRSAK